MAQLLQHGFNLTKPHMTALADAIKNKTGVILSLLNKQLMGEHILPVTKSIINRIEKAVTTGKGLKITFSNTALQRAHKRGGIAFLPALAAAAPLAASALSPLISKGVDALFGLFKGKGLIVPGASGGKLQLIPLDQVDPGTMVIHIGKGLFLPGTIAAYRGDGILEDIIDLGKKLPGAAKSAAHTIADYAEEVPNIPGWMHEKVKKKRSA